MDDAQTWRRVFSKMTSLQHESDDDRLSVFSALAIGRIPAYLFAKAKQTDRKG
jgi:hypothetical protein